MAKPCWQRSIGLPSDRLHKALMRNKRYRTWHRSALHSAVHWLILFAFLASGILGPALYFSVSLREVKAGVSTYTFSQNDWGGGADMNSRPAHPSGQTGWTKYHTKDAAVTAVANAGLLLTAINGSFSQNTADRFAAGTHSQTIVERTGAGAGAIVQLVADRVSKIAAGYLYSLALKSDGTLWAWGMNDSGQLGLGDTTNRNVPTKVGTDTNWSAIVAGGFSSLALKSDGTLWVWGRGGWGQLGLGDNTNRNVPTKVGTDTNWSAIMAGYYHSLVLKSDGTLWAWGLNDSGQLGLGDTTNRNVPTKVGTDTNWSAISAGANASLALKSNGTLWTWGMNDQGQLGLGYNGDEDSGVNMFGSVPIKVGSATDWSTAVTGGYHTLALRSNGALWAWGDNSHGQIGPGNVMYTEPIRVTAVIGWSALAGGNSHSLALKSDGTLWAWGWNVGGSLGLGDFVDRHDPTKVPMQAASGYTTGVFTSTVMDPGQRSKFSTLSYVAQTPVGTTLAIDARAGNTPIPDGIWTDWQTNIPNGGDISSFSGNRYVQYRVNFARTSQTVTPSFSNLTIGFSSYYPSGTLISSPFNSTAVANAIANIKWEIYPSLDTTDKFQLRTAPDVNGNPGVWTSWQGSGGPNTYFTKTDGTDPIPAVLSDGINDQWFQYLVLLETTNPSVPSGLRNVAVTYAVPDVVPAVPAPIAAPDTTVVPVTPVPDVVAPGVPVPVAVPDTTVAPVTPAPTSTIQPGPTAPTATPSVSTVPVTPTPVAPLRPAAPTLPIVPAVSAAPVSFLDVPVDHWLMTAGYVQRVYDANIMTGQAGKLRPWAALTRAELLKMVFIAFVLDAPEVTTTVFQDMPVAEWPAKYTQAAYQKQMLAGQVQGDKRYANPYRPVNRAEVLKIIARAAGFAEGNAAAVGFSDVQPDDWFSPFVRYFKDNGIVSGCTAVKFCPSGNITRAEAAKIIIGSIDHQGQLGR